MEKLKKSGAEGIILGCTEIPLLINQDDRDIPVFDTATIHADAALEAALNRGVISSL
ncbi:MAG: aspartate/glutamate racemase family protein [Thermodesulfobacteriota bacterium]|nr:aspartate/glutamate racemase family protein [Thermodesulfobacteriota bacterium]